MNDADFVPSTAENSLWVRHIYLIDILIDATFFARATVAKSDA